MYVCVCVYASVWGREEGKQNMGEIKLILRRIAVQNMGKVRCHGVSTMILSSGIALGKKKNLYEPQFL